MRPLIATSFLLFVVATFINTSDNTASAKQTFSIAPKSLSAEVKVMPDVSARAYEVFDIETGDVLLSFNTEEVLPIASVTKLFTAAAVMEDSSDETIVITYNDLATEGRSGKLEAGQEFSDRELLFPLLIESSNDAATALSHNLEKISVGDRDLADASGLSSANKATVSELGVELRNLYTKFPHIFDVTTLKQYIGEHTGWVNNSPVYDMDGYKGGKHGYTLAANRTLVAVFAEEALEDRELGYVLLGSDDLRADTEKLRAVIKDSVRLE